MMLVCLVSITISTEGRSDSSKPNLGNTLTSDLECKFDIEHRLKRVLCLNDNGEYGFPNEARRQAVIVQRGLSMLGCYDGPEDGYLNRRMLEGNYCAATKFGIKVVIGDPVYDGFVSNLAALFSHLVPDKMDVEQWGAQYADFYGTEFDLERDTTSLDVRFSDPLIDFNRDIALEFRPRVNLGVMVPAGGSDMGFNGVNTRVLLADLEFFMNGNEYNLGVFSSVNEDGGRFDTEDFGSILIRDGSITITTPEGSDIVELLPPKGNFVGAKRKPLCFITDVLSSAMERDRDHCYTLVLVLPDVDKMRAHVAIALLRENRARWTPIIFGYADRIER